MPEGWVTRNGTPVRAERMPEICQPPNICDSQDGPVG